MVQLLLTPPFMPFATAIAILLGLLVLELVFALIGGTLLGIGGDGLDVDAPAFGDVDLPEMGLDLDGLDVDIGDLELAEFEVPATELGTDVASPAAWLGFGKMPALIWLAVALFAFGLGGMVLQNVLLQTVGFALPPLVASIPAAAFALWFARSFGAVFARLLPKTESEIVSERQLARRPGIVTQGTAARGKPAEVRVTDRYGNTHYIRAEPLRDDQQIPQGSEVLVLRYKQDLGFRIISLSA